MAHELYRAYYVLDRDGSNQSNGASWSEDPSSHLPADLPYWQTRVVDGGDVGGILATAAVDETNRRIHFSTAPGEGSVNSPPNPPQLPTVHALDMDDGSVLWQNVGETPELASFSSVSVIPGVAVAGTSVGAILRPYFAPTGLPCPPSTSRTSGSGPRRSSSTARCWSALVSAPERGAGPASATSCPDARRT